MFRTYFKANGITTMNNHAKTKHFTIRKGQ